MRNPFPDFVKRKVVQWATAYAAVGFFLVEVLDIVGGRFHWPEFMLEASLVLVASGLLVTLVLAWFHGEKGRGSRASFRSWPFLPADWPSPPSHGEVFPGSVLPLPKPEGLSFS